MSIIFIRVKCGLLLAIEPSDKRLEWRTKQVKDCKPTDRKRLGELVRFMGYGMVYDV